MWVGCNEVKKDAIGWYLKAKRFYLAGFGRIK